MSKVAICIAGEMRYWEITKNVFNSFDADIFISTWDTNDRQDNYPYKFHGNKNINNDPAYDLISLATPFLGKAILFSFSSFTSYLRCLPTHTFAFLFRNSSTFF